MIELLAPAGNFDALKAAVHAGANAVYLAGSNFGARAYAENFSGENLRDAVKFAHLHNVAIHVTTNTILNDAELENFAEYVKFLRRANVDALLVQDLGAAKIIKTVAPEIPLHASTQMTVHNLAGVEILAKLGFSRVVLARELSLTEIENIAKNSPVETEIFAHGALCVCFSGQCLMSSMIGGRSGNRGRCAQPCRLPYSLVDDKGNELLKNAGEYLLSPKDLNTLEILPRLIEAGVDSLKIEGRMKRAEYVATVVKVYRAALDKNFSTPEDRRALAQIFNRDFTTAYLEKNPGKNLISVNRPNNRGVLIGRVVAVDKNKISLKLAEKINAGDQLEIWVKVGGRVTFTVENFSVDGEICTVEVENTRGVKVHDRAFKIFDAELIKDAQKYFADDTFGKIPVAAEVTAEIGAPLKLTLTDGENSATAQTNFLAEVAKNRPLTFDTLFKQIGRLGNSVFELVLLKTHMAENLMVPLSELNEVRRAAVEQLENLRLQKFIKNIPVTTESTAEFSVPLSLTDNKNSVAENLMVPLSELNETRRAAVEQLENLRLQKFIKNIPVTTESTAEFSVPLSLTDNKNSVAENLTVPLSELNEVRRAAVATTPLSHYPTITAQVDTLEKIKAALEGGADSILYGGENFSNRIVTPQEILKAEKIVHSANKNFYLATPRLVRQAEISNFEKILTAADFDAVYVHNIGTLQLAKKISTAPIHTDFSLIVFNSETINFLKSLGVEGVTLSPELTLAQVKSLLKKSCLPVECIVHGRAELMISAYCTIGSFLGNVENCPHVCRKNNYFLRDRKNILFPVVTDQFCRMHILNSKVLSMIENRNEFDGAARIRIDGRFLSVDELAQVVHAYKVGGAEIENYTRGHYFRGVE